MKKLLLLCTLVLFPALHAQSISGRIHENNANGWWNYFGDHPIGDTKWGAHLEVQWRRNNIATNWQQLLIRPAVNYSLRTQQRVIEVPRDGDLYTVLRYLAVVESTPFGETDSLHRLMPPAGDGFVIVLTADPTRAPAASGIVVGS